MDGILGFISLISLVMLTITFFLICGIYSRLGNIRDLLKKIAEK